MTQCVIIDFIAYRNQRLNKEKPSAPPISEELVTEIKNLIERLRACKTIHVLPADASTRKRG